MNKTAISWTKRTWNFIHGCSKVSDGCRACYAMELSLRRGWTPKPWTIQNEADNVLMKPHKLIEAYDKDLLAGDRVFVNSMSDMFHRAIPDWYKAVGFCLMLDRDDVTFQILTKRAAETIEWEQRFQKALKSPEFIQFRDEQKGRRGRWAKVYEALCKEWDSPWGDNIWMGTSVEDQRVIHRIDDLRQCSAKTRFVSAEPLLGAWDKNTALKGIHWVIVGGESGQHMEPDNGRWMKQEWARGIRDLCLDQGVAFFYKQDSAKRTEVRTALRHDPLDGGRYYLWQQYPDDMSFPIQATRSGNKLDETEKSVNDVTNNQYWEQKVKSQRQVRTATKWEQITTPTRAKNAPTDDEPYAPDYDMPWKEYTPSKDGIISPIAVGTTNGASAPTPPAPKHTITVYTAQMSYDDPDAVDITVKSATMPEAKVLAPRWHMVINHKAGRISDEQYTEEYYKLMRLHYTNCPHLFKKLLERDRLVLKCYCAAGNFCHRHLAVDILEKTALKLGINFVRGGELQHQKKLPETITNTDGESQLTLL